MARRKLIPVAVMALFAGCTPDGEPFGLEREQKPDAVQGALRCQVDVRGGSLTCTPQQPAVPSGASGVIVGGQGTYVLLESSNVRYDGGTQVFSADVTVRNLLTQTLGTTNGESRDPAGVRVFFHAGPVATAGTGVVTVKNPDGTGTFTRADQAYFEYTQVLSPGRVSLPRKWEWNVPSSVERFTFTVYVSAAAAQEDSVEAGLRMVASTIAGGGAHSCGLTINGTAYCWGSNALGRLGDGGVVASTLTPVQVSAQAGTRFVAISAGTSHTCAVAFSGAAYCWGAAAQGQLGNGLTTPIQSSPVPVQAPAGVQFVSISTRADHTCSLASSGAAYCWGSGGSGRLGNGQITNQSTPVKVAATEDTSFISISAGIEHTCAVATSGAAYCWGNGTDGRLGNGSTTGSSTPVRVQAPAGVRFVSISAGLSHTCALATSGAGYCWGNGTNGRLGNGSTATSQTPVAVVSPAGVSFVSIGVGDNHSCAIASTGAAYCWGNGNLGQLGDGRATAESTPVLVALPGVSWVSISGGAGHTCAVASTGSAYCWGAGGSGRLGNGSSTQQNSPAAVSTVTNFAWLDHPEAADRVPGRTPFSAYALAERLLQPPARNG